MTTNDPLIEEALTEWSRSRFARTTLVNYRACLYRLRAWLIGHGATLSGATRGDLRAYLADRELQAKASTVHGDWKAMVAFYGFLADEDELDGRKSPMENIGGPKLPKRTPLHIATENEVATLLAACDADTNKRRGRRAAAMIALLWQGMRRGEVAELRIMDVDLALDVVTIGAEGIVKSGVFRRIGVDAECHRRLRRAIKDRGAVDPTCALFVGTKGKLTPSGMEQALQQYRRKTGLMHVTLHSFRRGFTAWAIQAGLDPKVIMANNGWTDRRMLDRYTAGMDQDYAIGAVQAARNGKPRLRSVG